MTQSPSLRAPGTTWSPQTCITASPRKYLVPATWAHVPCTMALLEHQVTLPHHQMLLGGPLLGASVTLGQFIVTQSEGHAPESKKSHAEAHQNQLCNILHVLQVFSRFQCGAMTRDSRLQGFVGPCVAWGSLTLQGGGHALHGAHSRIILDH